MSYTRTWPPSWIASRRGPGKKAYKHVMEPSDEHNNAEHCRRRRHNIWLVGVAAGFAGLSAGLARPLSDPEYAGAGDTKGDALAAAGVGYFVGPNAAPSEIVEKPKHAHKHAHQQLRTSRARGGAGGARC